MKHTVQVVTELRLRREAEDLRRRQLIARLQLRCREATGLTEGTVRDWERRLHVPSGVYEDALCEYFGVDSIAKLGLGHEPAAAENWTWATKTERKREVNRRTLLRRGLTSLGALLPVGPLQAAAQTLGGRRTLDRSALEAAEQIATHLATRYVTAPDGEVGAAAIAHARTLADRLAKASMTPKIRTGLAAVASDAAALAGFRELHADRRGQADSWFGRALALARDAGDRRLEALAIASTAWTVSESTRPGWGDRSGSLAAVEAAAALSRHLPAAGRAFVNGHLARELAGAGDEPGSGRALERALEAAALVGRDDPGWGWWSEHAQLSGWDGSRITVFSGLRPLYLGRHREAVPLLEAAFDGTAVPIRRATLHQDLANAWVGLGDADRACGAAIAAVDESDAHGLGIIAEEIRQLRASFPPAWPQSVVADLDERLALV